MNDQSEIQIWKECKEEKVLILILDPKQLWKFEEKTDSLIYIKNQLEKNVLTLKLDGTVELMMEQDANNNMMWSTQRKGSMIYIQNDSNLKVLTLKQDNVTVELMDKDTKDYSQLWRKGTPNIEGYFTLENYQSKTFMTATSDVDLAVKGLMSNLNYPVLHLKRLFL